MEVFGLLAFILVLGSLGMSSKYKKLNIRLLKLEKATIKMEGLTMSEILKGLVGEFCSIKESSGLVKYEGTILAVDDEWIKLSIVKKNIESIVVKRIEKIDEVSIINTNNSSTLSN